MRVSSLDLHVLAVAADILVGMITLIVAIIMALRHYFVAFKLLNLILRSDAFLIL